MAEYLHLDSSLLTLLQYRDSAHRGSQSLTVLAEDSGHIDFTVNHYVGLSWPVKCGGFAALDEFIQVLRHNVDSHHLSQLLGYEIAGWRILRRGDYERKSPIRQRRQLRVTPTPTLKLIGITQRSVAGDASRPLSSTVPSHLLTQLVVSPTQSLSSFSEESITVASYKMDIILHLLSQESLLTLEMDSAWDTPTNPPASIMFADSSFPDLSPSLITKTTVLFNELEVLPTGVSGMPLLEQLKPHVPEMDSYFLSRVVQTLLPSHQDPSILPFPTSGRLQSVDSTWILPPLSVSQELQNITPGQANTSPKVVHSIKFLTATIGCLFFFPIPANTFYDEEDGNSTRLSLQIIPADGSPSGSESWLQFNTSQQTMHGYPLDIDFQYSPQEFVLSATDSGGLTARESFTIDLLKTTDVPCHLYTVRTKNSYYSFLRDRKRIGLFLEKLSLYLNSSSPTDIVVTALKPGSTVISWYNSSLCTSANASSSWCAKDEIQEALEKLRVPGGYVSPRFVRAMLPEYKIEVVFNISYSEVCFPTTKPFNEPFNRTVPTLQDKTDTRIRKTPSALLSGLCVTAGVVLMILVYWFCKCHRKTPRSQSVTFQRNSHLRHAKIDLDVLKPHKAPVHECRASLSPQLWIPPSASLISQEQYSRPIPLPHIIPSFQPPKYQLPPCYQEGTTTQND
ncbi:dystroglycan-like [Limosa lapponica baueri]|uniref:Dystroglycan-like n=1 Tax=Limosa lapponica baueri TaxID=1758121 RepID=A0A2I0TPM6_LIMLA|nr:dystroglycan-like [Limosa lapponica baueri]